MTGSMDRIIIQMEKNCFSFEHPANRGRGPANGDPFNLGTLFNIVNLDRLFMISIGFLFV
jgi:hypothetical protein